MSTSKPSPSSQTLHNPFAGLPYAWQLTETVAAFLARLPPQTIRQLEEGAPIATDEDGDGAGGANPDAVPWIFICNPFIGPTRRAGRAGSTVAIRGCEDEGPEDDAAQVARFVQGGAARLELLAASLAHYTTGGGGSTSGLPRNAAAAREMAKDRQLAVDDTLMLAQALHVRCGKVCGVPVFRLAPFPLCLSLPLHGPPTFPPLPPAGPPAPLTSLSTR